MKSIYYLAIATSVLTLTACGPQNYDNTVVDQTYVHRYGVAVPSDFWTASGEHGSVISTMNDGVVVTRSYTSGLLDGDTTYSFPHSSQIQKSETYVQGSQIKQTEFYFDGNPKSQTAFDSPLGMKTVSSWYLSGTPRSIEQFSGDLLMNGEYLTATNQNDANVSNYAGTRLVRDDYGQLLSTDTIQGGMLASRTTYHSNGSPKEVITYKDGLADGTIKTYYPGGEPATIEQWSAGKQTGNTTMFQHGEKFADVSYVDGVKQGTERRYRDGTAVVQEISWSNDMQHGPVTTYVGDTAKTTWYYKGNPTSQKDYEFMTNRPVAH